MNFGNWKLQLVSPHINHTEAVQDYIREYFRDGGDADRAIFFNQKATAVYGTNGLFHYAKNYSDWLEKLEKDSVKPVDQENVPSQTFFLIRERTLRYGAKNIIPRQELVGMVNIRLGMNDISWNHDGSIGYNIRPSLRGNGYAKMGLFLTLCKCQEYGTESVLLTCDKANLASIATIRALGGKFSHERQFHEQQYALHYYTIDVENAIAHHDSEYDLHIIQ